MQDAIARGSAAYEQWRRSEPRLWGRTVRFIYRMLNIRADFAQARKGVAAAEQRALHYLEGGIARWEAEDRVSAETAEMFRAKLASPEVTVALQHLGAHLLISAVFRFPLGSIIRVLWTLTFMVRAFDSNLRLHRRAGEGGVTVHNPLVLLVGAIPGFGAIAYMFSKPLLRPWLMRLAIDETAHGMPFGLYGKLRCGRWLAPEAKPRANRPASS